MNFTDLAISINNGNHVNVPVGQTIQVPVTIWNPPVGYYFYFAEDYLPPSDPFSGNPNNLSFLNQTPSDGSPMTDYFNITAPPGAPGATGSMTVSLIGRPLEALNNGLITDFAHGTAQATIMSVPQPGGMW